MIKWIPISAPFLKNVMLLMERDCKVVEITQSRVKIKSELTNLMKVTQIEGYNGKYGSNPQGNRKILKDVFEFEQIGQ